MKEIDHQLTDPGMPESIPSHPAAFTSPDDLSPMPWPNTYYPVTPTGPETEYPCPCSEGDSGTASTDNNSVDFSIEFGRFPKWPELNGGRLMLNLNMMDASLCWGTVFQYQHVSQRCLEVVDSATTSVSRPEEPEDVSQAVVKTERGFPRYYKFASASASGADVLGGTQMFRDRMRRVVVDGIAYLEEVQENGMIMRFRPRASMFDHIVTPRGVKITAAELMAEIQVVRQDASDEPGMTVESFNSFSLFMLKQVWNKTDGLLDLSDVRRIKWYASADVAGRRSDGIYTIREGAVPIKTWKLSWTFGDMETVIARAVDEDNQEIKQMMLQTLRIEEPGGFVSEWRGGLYPDDLTLVKGEGDDAVSIVTMCRPAEGRKNMVARDVNGQAMVAGGYYTDRKEKFKYVYSGVAGTDNAVLCSAEKEVYQRQMYGDVLVSRTEGYDTPLARTWTYGYGSDTSSPNYGKRIRETRPDGSVIEMEYDSSGNVIQRTEPWYEGVSMKTSYSYVDEMFNDQRFSEVKVELLSFSETVCLEKTRYEYNRTDLVYSIISECWKLGSSDSITTVEEWNVNNGFVHARGRIKCRYQYEKVQDESNPDLFNPGSPRNIIRYEYSSCNDYSAAWKCTENDYLDTVDSEKSTRTIRYYAENGDEIAVDDQVNLGGERFVSIDFRQMSHDASHRVIRTDYANGLFSMAEWSCAGPLWETDVSGLQTCYTYDGAKRLVRIERDAAVAMEDWNDADMNAICPCDITEMTYDGAGRTLSVSLSIGDRKTTVSSAYDMLGRLIYRMDELGRITRYSYSEDGLTVTEATPPGATIVTRKTASGLVVEESGTGREACYYNYEIKPSGIWKHARRLSLSGDLLESILENRDGQVLSVLRPNTSEPGAVTVEQYCAQYNGFGQILYERKGDEWPFWYLYDNRGELFKWKRSLNGWAESSPDWFIYLSSYRTNSNSFIPGLPAFSSNLVWRVERFVSVCCYTDYDYEDREELVSRKDSSLKSLAVRLKNLNGRIYWEKTCNENGNVHIFRGCSGCDGEQEEIMLNGDTVRLVEPDGAVTQYKRIYTATGDILTVRDARGKDMTIVSDMAERETSWTDQDGKVTITLYDAVTGQPSCVTTPNGKQMWSTYDSRGRLVCRYGTAVQPMKWEYDDHDRIVALHTYRSAGNILDVTPSSGSDVTRWDYGSVTGFLMNKIYPDGSMTSYQYDDWGRIDSRTHSRGVTTSYRYDTATGKIASIVHSDGTPSVSFSYDGVGQLIAVQDASGSRSIAYLNFESVWYESTSGTDFLSYSYDSFKRLSGYTLSLNGTKIQQVALEYDSLSRLSKASLNGEAFTYGHDLATGWLDSLAYPNGMVRKTVFHDNLPLVSSLTYMKETSSTPMLKHAYTWDNMRRPSVREDYVGSSTISRRHAYGYNARGELTGDTMNAGGSFSYAYDNIGNRLNAAEQGISSVYQGNSLNQYTNVTRSGTSFTPAYDADGNQTCVNTSTGTWSVQYNADNRPVIFTQGNKKVECVYDYLGRRVEKVEYDGNNLTKRTRYAYMEYLMVASMDCTQDISNPVLLGTWFWDPSEPVATRALAMCTHNADKSVSSTRYVAHDLLKSVSALFDSSGTRQAEFEYTPYGETLTAQGAWAMSMPFRYSSEYRDEDLGLIYYNYRHYNPRDGRWISRDPIGEQGGECLYGFVNNKVNSFIDVLGLAPQLYENLEEAILAGMEAVQDASDLFYYQQLGEYQEYKSRNHTGEKIMSAPVKREFGLRVCCDSKSGKFYLAKVSGPGNHDNMAMEMAPPCEKEDKMVAAVHCHVNSNPKPSEKDKETAIFGLPSERYKLNIRPEKIIPPRIDYAVISRSEKGEIRRHVFDHRTRTTREIFVNGKKRKSE